jgi:drug/metabolite transporter (DMT)-like permease
MNNNIWKSIGAVLAGILVGAVFSLGTDVVLHAAHVFPPWDQPASNALLLLATACRTVYSIAGSYVTARLAPNRPMLHVLVLGALGLVVCIVGAVATWNKGPAFGPHWYPVALIVLAMPQCWVGGRLYEMQLRARAVG